MDASRVEKKLGINSLNICDTTQKKGDLGLSQQNFNLFEWVMWPLAIDIHMISDHAISESSFDFTFDAIVRPLR